VPKKTERLKVVTVPIEWVVPDTVNSVYATNIVAQQDEHEVVISFFEVRKPVILGDPDAVSSKMAALSKVPAVCVARISIHPDRLSGFIEALRQVEKRTAQAGQNESEEVV